MLRHSRRFSALMVVLALLSSVPLVGISHARAKSSFAVHGIDFDGNGISDIFFVSSGSWKVLPDGRGPLKLLNYSKNLPSEIAFGDFRGDGKTDVVGYVNRRWVIFDDGIGGGVPLNSLTDPLSQVRFGDFDGDGKTDAFSIVKERRKDHQDLSGDGISDFSYEIEVAVWRISRGASKPWEVLQQPDKSASAGGVDVPLSSPITALGIEDVVLGDFNGDGKSEVLLTNKPNAKGKIAWLMSISGVTVPHKVGEIDAPASKLLVADLDGDSKDDILTVKNGRLMISNGGGSVFVDLGIADYSGGKKLVVGNYDKDRKWDVLTVNDSGQCLVSWGGASLWEEIDTEISGIKFGNLRANRGQISR